MKRLLLVAGLALAGCAGYGDADQFRAASPSRQGINIQVPSNGQSLESSDLGQSQQKLLGEQSVFYKGTRDTTLSVNEATRWVLDLCEDIVSNPPTTIDDGHAVWGPWTDALSPNTYRFTVSKVGAGFDYSLEGKDKTQGDDAFLKLISGHHDPGQANNQGQGTFHVDWDAGQALPEHDPNLAGSGDFTYARNALLDVTVEVQFHQVWDAGKTRHLDATYAFAQANGADGSFDFVTTDADGNRLSVRSRWHQDGEGRADVKGQKPDGSVLGTISDCWGATFLEVYYSESFNPAAQQGVEQSCAFATPEFSSL